MIVPPNKAIGVISCACIVIFTLIVLLKFNSETWITRPSVRIQAPAEFQASSNVFTKQLQLPAFEPTQSQTFQRPKPVEPNTDRGRELSPEVVDLWTPPSLITSVAYNSGFGYPEESSDPGIVERLSSKDMASLQSLPAACTTDLQEYLQRQPTAQTNPQGAVFSTSDRYPLNEQPAVVATADETLYNPHVKATQAAFSSASATKANANDNPATKKKRRRV